MRDIQVLKIPNGGRLLLDLSHVVAIERTAEDDVLIMYTLGHHTFRVSFDSAHDAMGVIEKWTERAAD